MKPGSKKEQCFHPYKKSKRGRGGRQQAPQGVYYQPMTAPQYMVQQPFFQHPPQGGRRGGHGGRRDTQYQVLPLQNPGLELTMPLGDPLHCVFPVTPPEGEKTLSVLSLSEREKTPCVQSPKGEGKTPCVQPPPVGGKTPCVQSPPEGEKTLVVRSQDTSKLVQFKSVFIPEKDLPVGGRLRQFLPEWEKHGSHQLITGLIRDGYKLPFREHPNLSRVPCIISSYTGFNKQSALWTSIQDLLQKGAVDVVHTPESLGFYSRLFLVPKPGNCWRPFIDLSSLNKFLAIPKFKMETPESIRASLRKGEWVTSIDLTDTYLHVPIHTQSQKYLRFHFKGVTYQFTSLPFGLATAPLIFTSIVKEVKLMALQSGIRLHQYLDDWLIHAPSEQQCTVQTQKLLKLVKDLGFIVNLKIWLL